MAKKHLTLSDRVIIEDSLYRGESLYSIANHLHKSVSTISREIQRNRIFCGRRAHDCVQFRSCHKKHVCGNARCNRECRSCKEKPCQRICSDYTQAMCDRIIASPYVCNGCNHWHKHGKYGSCQWQQAYYDGEKAEEKYRSTLVNMRNGFDCTLEEINAIDEMASPMLKNGCSVYHVVQTLGDKLPVSASTLYRMIDSCELEARNIDLRNKVKRRERRHHSKPKHLTIDKVGRTYDDYLQYIEKHETTVVEMDCVEGTKEDKAVLLTLHLTDLHFQMALILDRHDAANVVHGLDMVETMLGLDLFQQIFPLILTDNGHEFTDIDGMERSCTVEGEKRTKIFFCEPNRSDQKGACENNHRFIRYVIPKGTSIENLSQEKVNLLMNHINNFKRKSLYGRSPYELAKMALPEDFFVLLGFYEIPGEEVVLNPDLLKD